LLNLNHKPKGNKMTQSERKQNAESDAGNLAKDAQELITATANATDEKVTEARKRLESALATGKQFLSQVQSKAVAGAKAADECIREHPYQSLAVAFGVGAIVGFLLTRRSND
jgi:ElaB/YqjD/DUF883 family membrane-anchored ribosome-binding protein